MLAHGERASPGRWRITANQVTLARLLSMPFLAWACYQGETGGWVALILGIAVGLTDKLDGWLARRQGPTVLGGLLDPIADKVFIAVLYVPFADLGWLQWWVVALVFVREFLVTALRTLLGRARVPLQTSYLAKAKTWIQMQAAGTLMLVLLIHDPQIMRGLILTGAALSMLAAVLMGWWWRRFPRGAVIMLASFGLLWAFYARGREATLPSIGITVLVVTWVSGLDYFLAGLRQLRGRDGLSGADLLRGASGVGLPVLALGVLHLTEAPAAPLAALLATELAIGGLDNLLAAHHASLGPGAWAARTLSAAALLLAALALQAGGATAWVPWAAHGAALASAAGALREFWRNRDHYLDGRIGDLEADAGLSGRG